MNKMIEKLRRHLFWPGMVLQCFISKSTKSPNKVLRPPMRRPTISDRLFQRLYMDLLGPYPWSKGNIGLLIIVDPVQSFTKSESICEFLRRKYFTPTAHQTYSRITGRSSNQVILERFCAYLHSNLFASS